MVMYSAYMVLVICFVLVIVLNAWFVRRLNGLGDKVHTAKEDGDRQRKELTELTEAIDELNRGKDSNAVSTQVLAREIEEIQEKIKLFLEEHPGLKEEFGEPEQAAAVDEDPDEEEEILENGDPADEETQTASAAEEMTREE